MNCMVQALFCVHGSLDCNNWKHCCVGVSECLCVRSTYCLAVDAVPRSVGFSQDPDRGECFKCGVYCCDCALIQPRVCCGFARQTLCMHGAGSLPLHEDYVKEPACALYFVGCKPKCGICVPPPKSNALESMFKNQSMVYGTAPGLTSIDRDEDDYQAELVSEYHDSADR